jgi:uncharacterized protein (DUF1778 family)
MSHSSQQKTNQKTERLEARISAEQKELFQRAANIQGRKLTEFIIDSAREKAECIVRDQELIYLSARDRKVFIDALLAVSSPNERLRTAADRYRKVKGE